LKAVQTINRKAVQEADRLDSIFAESGPVGSLHCVPILMKDQVATVGIGEDTGGSVRGPAAVNNLVGLRPTLPLVSRFGMMPARPTTDTLGPIARPVRDAAIILEVIAGYDANDPVTVDAVGRVPATYTQFLKAELVRSADLQSE
jgi:amidase